MIYHNEYFSAFPEAKGSDNISETDFSEIFFNSMLNGLNEQAYVQGFYCENNTVKKYVNISERMEIAESIY